MYHIYIPPSFPYSSSTPASSKHRLIFSKPIPRKKEFLFAPVKCSKQKRLRTSTMIYDVRSEYYQAFLSTKQGPRTAKPKAPANPPSTTQPADAMDTDD